MTTTTFPVDVVDAVVVRVGAEIDARLADATRDGRVLLDKPELQVWRAMMLESLRVFLLTWGAPVH